MKPQLLNECRKRGIDLAVLALVVLTSIVPGLLWRVFDDNLYIDGQKIVPAWLLAVWPLYALTSSIVLSMVGVRSATHAWLRAALVIIWIGVWLRGVVPLSDCGMEIIHTGGHILNRSECYSVTITFMAVPTGLCAGFVIGWWRRCDRGVSGYSFSLRQLFVLIVVAALWTAVLLTIWRECHDVLRETLIREGMAVSNLNRNRREGFLEVNFSGSPKSEARAMAVVE